MTLSRIAAAASLLLLAASAQSAVSLTPGVLNYTQDFDTLPNSNGSDPVWLNDATLPGWSLYAGPGLDTPVSNLRVSTSSGSDRAHISYGINGSTDRALGSQGGSSHRYAPVSPAEGEAFGAVAVAFSNDSGQTLDSFSFSYTGEQWHVSSNANVAHGLIANWALGSATTAFNALEWQSFTAAQAHAAGASFYTPTISGGTSGNGNLPQNRIENLGASVGGLDWAPGQVLWLRWVDVNDRASDHGFGIDDFNLSVTAVPEPTTAVSMLLGLGVVGSLLRARSRRR